MALTAVSPQQLFQGFAFDHFAGRKDHPDHDQLDFRTLGQISGLVDDETTVSDIPPDHWRLAILHVEHGIAFWLRLAVGATTHCGRA